MKIVILLACTLAFANAEGISFDNAEALITDEKCRIPCRIREVRNISHPFDCMKYGKCSNGRFELKACPPGQKYNTGLNSCVNPIGGAGQGCIPCWSRRPLDW